MPVGTSAVAHRVAAATPAERDRFADLLRVASILVVVAGHWLMAVVAWRDGRVEGGNALALVPGLWLATWLLQVMPLFFFVGGLANLVSARRGGGWDGFVRGRAARLLRPTLAFLAVWAGGAAALGLAGVPEAVLRPVARLVVQPLWFLGLYLLVVAVAPAMLRLHRRFGPAVVLWLGLAAAAADVAGRVPGLDRVGELNFLLVWLFAHQLGFLYADGTLAGWPRRAHAGMAGGGLAALVALTASGAWPPSMVGLPGDRVSNMSPPSLCIVALTVWLVGLAMLVRAPVTRWLERPRPWALVVTAGSALMTLFLWHLTALVLAVLVLHPLGLTEPSPGTPTWWALRPLWVLVSATLLVPLVALFARFERPRPPLWTTASTRTRRGLRSPSGGPSIRPGRCPLPGAGAGTEDAGTPDSGTAGAILRTVLGMAGVILGLLGVAVGGIWPLPGTTAELAGLRISPGAGLLCLGVGVVLLGRGRLEG
ncbi:MAG TPA: acyltransferase [Actinomycetota bacterium]|nr:acyltransferase [Actinomycetota bacterium]